MFAVCLTAIPFHELTRMFKRVMLNFRLMHMEDAIGTALNWLIILILEFAVTLMQIYTALAIGHQWTEHRILGSVLAYFGINVVKNIIGGLLMKIGYYTGSTVFLASQFEQTDMASWQVQVMIIVSALAMIVIYSAATWYLLDRRINLE